ncbi:1-deoxy-D-xylulose-5-phosphate reductoisomerase [Clostridium sp. 19966]|uniref:1-deoxy-D-xylulose-5-phosphate reductoisomerase n=1 Tax=Clostridium sp. 19966 TaxID=2768166 RepID=UPI0028DD8D3C|nr:1-deoxy-D-xylulose-5-phosphate reductoisomerase [Clostridium sp. 19966]MDT8716426.1 1-deoxy-D-xylulose-5-phosphate reductoisomerase [Clostridium sp. 19966]
MKKIILLGATGSIGTQTLDIIRKNRDIYELVAVSANKSWDKIISIIDEFNPRFAVLTDEAAYNKVKSYCTLYDKKTAILYGMEGMIKITALIEADIVVTAVMGMIGIIPTLEAIKSGKNIALANKETLVTAGEIVTREAAEHNVKIIPVDSEHGAIFQSLLGNDIKSVNKIILTASGGPFRGRKFQDVCKIPKEEALKHPKWNMGEKISIDSATLMNKGLEVIEAHWLFNQDYDNIEVIIHPQSIIHSMVEYIDGSVIAQLGVTDMRLPIQYALNYPERLPRVVDRLNLAEVGNLTFEKPDMDNFPCLKIAYEAGRKGGIMPAVLNIANEAAVGLYLNNKISFGDIYYIVEDCMNKFSYFNNVTVEGIMEVKVLIEEYINKKIFGGNVCI